jgi:hypothetical protein
MSKEQMMLIFAAIVGLYFVVTIYTSWGSSEGFSPFESKKELNTYYEGATAGIKDYLVDTMVCSKKCCGDQWPVPFEGLSAAEIEQTIATKRNPGPFVRTNYMCANGIDGVGCPCINAKAYEYIVNHGHNAHTIKDIEPSFFIRGDVDQPGEIQGLQKSEYLSPYEVLQSARSMFVDTPKLNDMQLQRTANPVNEVISVLDVQA